MGFYSGDLCFLYISYIQSFTECKGMQRIQNIPGDRIYGTLHGPVVQSPVSANPELTPQVLLRIKLGLVLIGL